MRAKSIGLAWIVVKDLKATVKFYTEVVGLKLTEMSEEWGWAELEGHEEGMKLGIAQQRPDEQDPIRPGQNAVLTVSVDNLENAIQNLQKQGAMLIGGIEEVPGHVKMQTFRDTEGNYLQLVEEINEMHCSTGKSSCCCH